MVKDPVCGMEINEEQAVSTSTYQGETYYFCSSSCKHLFDQNPQHYTDDQQTAKA